MRQTALGSAAALSIRDLSRAAPVIWIGVAGELGAIPGGAINLAVTYGASFWEPRVTSRVLSRVRIGETLAASF